MSLERMTPDLELEEKVPAIVEETLADRRDHEAALLEALLSQRGSAQVVHGPEWAVQFRPPAMQGTFQAKYTNTLLPLRAVGWFILWVTWDWKRGAFVLAVAVLVVAIVQAR